MHHILPGVPVSISCLCGESNLRSPHPYYSFTRITYYKEFYFLFSAFLVYSSSRQSSPYIKSRVQGVRVLHMIW